MSHARRGLVALAIATVVLSAVRVPVQAHGTGAAWRPLYVALGDSLAAGEGATEPDRTGYVALTHRGLRTELDCAPRWRHHGCRRLDLLNVGRSATGTLPGVTTAAVIAEQLPVALPVIRHRNADRNRSNDVEVITIDVGGNDVFGPVTGACLGGITPDCASTIGTVLAGVAANYDTILGELRAAAGAETPIVVLTYYNPVPFCDLAAVPGAVELGELVLEGLPGLVPAGLNDLIRSAAATHGAIVAEGYGAMGAGDLVGGADCLHPTDSGHRQLSDLVVAATTG